MNYSDYVKELKDKCEVYLKEVELTGNETAYTDSLLEDVFTSVARLKDFYDKSDVDMVEDSITVVRTMDELSDYLDDKGWHVSKCSFGGGRVGWEIGQHSPAGEDFYFSIEHNNDVEEAINAIKEYAYDFDEEEHIEMYVEARKNGLSGVPSTKELVEDAKAIQEMLDDLADGVNWCEVKSIGEIVDEATRRSEEEYEPVGAESEKDVSLD